MIFPPLESNPDSINDYLNKIGLSTDFGISDIIGVDPDLLPFVIKPVYAVIFLFPCDKDLMYEEFTCLDEPDEERIQKDVELSADMYQIKQTIGNACGTMALIHAIANNLQSLELRENSILKNFLDSTKDKTPEERGLLLEKNEEMANAHQSCAQSGETEMTYEPRQHFIALVEHKGYLWKCDGSRKNPNKCYRVNITNRDTILESAAEYIRKFAELNPDNISFAAMALNKF